MAKIPSVLQDHPLIHRGPTSRQMQTLLRAMAKGGQTVFSPHLEWNNSHKEQKSVMIEDRICFPNYPEANPGTNMDIRTLKEDYMNTEGEKYVNSARIVSSATKLDKENLI
ncbi:hypothetical protein J1605_017641 [Eschrichtius robustus]|uniref:Uncharacterized protein n=1 Tax=Eschrichtius robustus TaxID=9764 RepID=A0AB34I1Z1_ESCRO|nr:hypothetical protein J1605_017641 [Eschrichtius robustus]